MSTDAQSAPSTAYAVPLPRVERSTSSNHTSLSLVFLGRFPIRPVAQSAASFRTCFLDRSATGEALRYGILASPVATGEVANEVSR
ncbi:nitrogen fixation protein FixI [Centipeda periodontii DSM 2778]|uniref:Nitrogen fixation protein FixI n=1 Tax=Centipeda periodontii DSM 2778 TaxID=888060 RepID=F5RQA5_9FIRM|nr:nitrogen fixation protein FixI [Centipeda periodontii DSM 2778]